jgi:hypothetical protein
VATLEMPLSVCDRRPPRSTHNTQLKLRIEYILLCYRTYLYLYCYVVVVPIQLLLPIEPARASETTERNNISVHITDVMPLLLGSSPLIERRLHENTMN